MPVEVLMNADPWDWTIAVLVGGRWSDVYRGEMITDPVTHWRADGSSLPAPA